MEPNTITIAVPWLPMLVVLGVVGVVFGTRGMRARSKERSAIAKAEAREEAQRLFPSPWDEVYEECSETDDNPESRGVLIRWLKAAKQDGVELPFLVPEAIHAFTCELTFPSVEWTDPVFWKVCLDILAPYDRERIETTRLADALEEEKEASEKLKVAEEKAAELQKKKALFNYPWDKAYEECRTKSPAGAQAWLRKWIPEQDNLCPISVEAADALIYEVTGNYGERKEFFELLSQCLDTGCYDTCRNISEYNLRDELPSDWYDFWKELKGYPSCKMLFMKLIGKFEKTGFMVHAATEVSLTSDQASLLSRALGRGNVIDTKFYADDLAKFVRGAREVPKRGAMRKNIWQQSDEERVAAMDAKADEEGGIPF